MNENNKLNNLFFQISSWQIPVIYLFSVKNDNQDKNSCLDNVND